MKKIALQICTLCMAELDADYKYLQFTKLVHIHTTASL